jgi:small multidrug resistance pump
MKSLTAYIFLVAGISFGIIANGYFLKMSQGFTKFLPSILGVVIILLAYFSLAKAMQTIPVGFTYATYGGLTTIGVTLLGLLRFNQIPNFYAIIGIIFILIGVVMVNYFGNLSG